MREEANAIVAYAFRSGFLEDLHAADYSELLKNKKLSRITNAAMKKLMIESRKRVAELLRMKEQDLDAYWKLIDWVSNTYTRNWQE